MANVGNWIGEITTTIGQGDVVLGGALPGYTSFNSQPPGDFWYVIVDGNDKEAGIAEYNGLTFKRNSISATLKNGVYDASVPTPLNLSGSAQVFCTFNKTAFDRFETAALFADTAATTFAPIVHGHNESDIVGLDKYTQGQVNSLLVSKSNLGHHHIESEIDDLDKYTQQEVDDELALKSDTGHPHTESDITDLDKYTQAEVDSAIANATTTGHTHTETDVTDLDKYTQAEVDALIVGKADNPHDHLEANITDLDKYTQAQVDALLSLKVDAAHTHTEDDIVGLDKYTRAQVDAGLAGKSDLVHTHSETDITDLDKYSQAETDTLLLGKANTSHSHTEADITNLDKYTQLEVDTLLTTKAESAHTHLEANILDLDKYTQAEVDSLLSGKTSIGHSHVESDITDLDKYTQLEADSAITAEVDAHTADPDPHPQYISTDGFPSSISSWFTDNGSTIDGTFLAALHERSLGLETTITKVINGTGVEIAKWMREPDFTQDFTWENGKVTHQIDATVSGGGGSIYFDLYLRRLDTTEIFLATSNVVTLDITRRTYTFETIVTGPIDVFTGDTLYSRLRGSKIGGQLNSTIDVNLEGDTVSRTFVQVPFITAPGAHAFSHDQGGSDPIEHDNLTGAKGRYTHDQIDSAIDSLQANDSAQDLTLADHETRIATVELGGGGSGHTHTNQAILDLVEEPYTTTEKNKLASIEAGAEANTVHSVNTRTGNVVITAADLGLENVDNTSDVTKHDDTDLTGTPTAPTAVPGTSTDQVATTAFVTDAVSGTDHLAIEDNDTSGIPVKLIFPDDTITDNLDGSFTYTPLPAPPAGSDLNVSDGTVDGIPSGLIFPAGSLTDNLDGTYTYTAPSEDPVIIADQANMPAHKDGRQWFDLDTGFLSVSISGSWIVTNPTPSPGELTIVTTQADMPDHKLGRKWFDLDTGIESTSVNGSWIQTNFVSSGDSGLALELADNSVSGTPEKIIFPDDSLTDNGDDSYTYTPPTPPAQPVAEFFPSGTTMLFQQTLAPTGWTKSTAHTNKALRVVSGVAGSGGSQNFTTAFANKGVSGTINNTTLSTAKTPSHTHSIDAYMEQETPEVEPMFQAWERSKSSSSTLRYVYTNSGGGSGGSHNHSFTGTAINLAVKYVDMILAIKD